MRKILVLIGWLGWSLAVWGQSSEDDLDLARGYYDAGDYEKAAATYAKVAENKAFDPNVYRPYIESLIQSKQSKTAEKFIQKTLRRQPNHPELNILLGLLYQRTDRRKEADSHWTAFSKSIEADNAAISVAARIFIDNALYAYAEQLYLSGQKNGRANFAYELGNLYAISGQSAKMIETYLGILVSNESQLSYIQNVLQARVQSTEQGQLLEQALYKKIQENPDRTTFNQLLIWHYLQQREFYRAFMQARALDKRQRTQGNFTLNVGQQALAGQDYENAIKIFEYLIANYRDQAQTYYNARSGLMQAKEALIKNTFPVDLDKIRSLSQDYQAVLDELGIKDYTAELARNRARLEAFYLDNKTEAIRILQQITQTPRLKQVHLSEAKLDLGDIYLLKGEWWEATLLYSQVEKAEPEQDMGHQAKLKNAKLSYYRGDFALAKSHLDILKLASSRKIANDAIALSLLIQENTGLDTSEVAMQRYAAADLLVFQQQYAAALKAYDDLLKAFPDHSLTDETLWQKAQIYRRQGQTDLLIAQLERILDAFGEDIWGDDANFQLAEIYETKDPEKAKSLYLKLLTDYPDSVYVVEARKRLRKLRGDLTP